MARKSQNYVEYSHNNSGGHWWLTDKNWKDLEKAGWKVDWVKDSPFHQKHSDKPVKRWLGALASKATKYGVLSLRDTVDEWEKITGQSATDAGCSCCGPPHNFTLYRNGKCVDSGPHSRYGCSW